MQNSGLSATSNPWGKQYSLDYLRVAPCDVACCLVSLPQKRPPILQGLHKVLQLLVDTLQQKGRQGGIENNEAPQSVGEALAHKSTDFPMMSPC